MRMYARRFGRILALALALTFLLTGTASARAMKSGYKKPYYIVVDQTNQIVTVYRTEDDSIARQMLCSTGRAMPTPTGTYYLPKTSREDMRSGNFYFFEFYDSYAKWATRIDGGILFHSVCYARADDDSIDLSHIKNFGNKASHGCVRLRIEDARFIAENCLPGTLTKIYYSQKPNEDLRTLLAFHSYTGDMPYERFCGTADSDDELGFGSTGSKVSDLQARLKDLGYLSGSVSGTYDAETVVAVKRLQDRLELPIDGVYSRSLDPILYSEDVPMSTDTTLAEGSVGLTVKRLQQALKEMGFYTGEIDEIFDEEVTEALKKFQHVNFFNETGVATPTVQAGVYYLQEQMHEVFGDLEGLNAEVRSETVRVGMMKTPNARKLHKKPSAASSGVGTLSPGETVLVAGTKSGWAGVWTSETAGYTYTANLKIVDRDNSVVIYSRPGSDVTFQMGYTMKEFNTGKKSFAISFDRYYEIQKFFYKDTVKRSKVKVDTGEDGVSLNLRAQPAADAEVLTQVPNGEELTAHSVGEKWTLVSWDGKVGYLMNQYLTFEEEEDTALDDTIHLTEEEGVHAQAQVVSTDGSSKAPVYDENAKKIGELPEGTTVEIVSASEDYEAAMISCQGHEGYMYLENLKSAAQDEEASGTEEDGEEEGPAEEAEPIKEAEPTEEAEPAEATESTEEAESAPESEGTAA